jgi:hypothetical protein
MRTTMEVPVVAGRITLLENALKQLRNFEKSFNTYSPCGDDGEQVRAQAVSFINRNLMAIRQAVIDTGVNIVVAMNPPPMVGGPRQTVDVLENVFRNGYGHSFIGDAIWVIERAIGVYEHIRDETGLVRLPTHASGLDLLDSIDRTLRPAFADGPPKSEKDVQDKIEIILRSLNIEFTREIERATVGPRSSIPDFVLPALNLALEAKFAHAKHVEGKVQEEINADVSAYATKWKHLVFVIYDVGAINDPDRMRTDNMAKYGVRVIIVKH